MIFDADSSFSIGPYPSGREIARIRPDGTWWIAENITLSEYADIFPILVKYAAESLAKLKEANL